MAGSIRRTCAARANREQAIAARLEFDVPAPAAPAVMAGVDRLDLAMTVGAAGANHLRPSAVERAIRPIYADARRRISPTAARAVPRMARAPGSGTFNSMPNTPSTIVSVEPPLIWEHGLLEQV